MTRLEILDGDSLKGEVHLLDYEQWLYQRLREYGRFSPIPFEFHIACTHGDLYRIRSYHDLGFRFYGPQVCVRLRRCDVFEIQQTSPVDQTIDALIAIRLTGNAYVWRVSGVPDQLVSKRVAYLDPYNASERARFKCAARRYV